MKLGKLIAVSLAPVVLLTGCDIFDLDNWDPPNRTLTGTVMFDGQPVGVRVNGVELSLWQVEPEFELDSRIPVYISQDGTFSVALFDGVYEIEQFGEGPWVADDTRRTVTVSGDTTFDVPVQPYYTIRNDNISYSGSGDVVGAVSATFNVGQHDTSREVEWVGLYVGRTTFVDRSPNFIVRSELGLADIQAELAANSPISLSVDLPSDIHVTQGAERRNRVFARVGLKVVGVSEMIFTPVIPIEI